ncbi:MAG: site-specific DNA-methyltransferase [Armatimonadetes bacterium]|nr:site-specific DNA-methyltransferase [Armatimonadota bacterium]CUU36845.1 site-specific DNA-methyltransferase (adenine-specific) [Armatimonadetes bacterium DC]
MVHLIQGDCLQALDTIREQGIPIALTFLDPPFNQGKDYAYFDDDQPEPLYWEWLSQVCQKVYECTEEGGAIYFMQREKNAEFVLRTLRETGWTLQNLIIWLKKTSAVPGFSRFGKQYQIIAFATKGRRPRVFYRLRIDLPPEPYHRYPRENGVFVTDCWSDIRELTSGYFAGDEALRGARGERLHKQQSPVALLLRILLSSTKPDDWVLDPFAGTGTTAVVAEQLGRHCVAIEIDPAYVQLIRDRLEARREADSVLPWRHYYRFTPELDAIWDPEISQGWLRDVQMTYRER